MRIETNHQLVKRNRRTANILFFASMAVLLGGFLVANLQLTAAKDPSAAAVSLFLPWIVLPVGFFLTMQSVKMTNQWLRRPRPEEAIQEGLKGLSKRSILYNYYHGSVRHVLVAPQGVFAIVTRFQEGNYTVEGDKWNQRGGAGASLLRFFRRDGIGNPTAEAMAGAAAIQQLLASSLPDVDVQPMVIFVDPRAELTLINPTIPILYASENKEPNLRDFMRKLAAEQAEKLPEPEETGKKKGKPTEKTLLGFNPEAVAEALEEATILT
jgi:hypothetical protein